MRIAVIVTTFNNVDSISRCLNSVKSFKNKLSKFEIKIILVDDASVDNTPEILLNFSNKIPLTEFKKYDTNQGVSKTRNYGISRSLDTDYLLFLDGDDELDLRLADYLNKNKLGSDLYAFDFTTVDDDKKTEHNHLKNSKIFNDESISDYFFDYLTIPNRNSMFVTCWAKLLKTKLLKTNANLRFRQEMRIYEDVQFIFRFIRMSKKIEYINIPSYIYNRANSKSPGQASLGGNWEVTQLFSFISALRQLRHYLIEKKQNIHFIDSKIFHCIAAYTCISSSRAWIRVQSFSDFFKMHYKLKNIYTKPIIEKSFKIYNVDIAKGNKLICFFLKRKYFLIASILTFLYSNKRYK